MGLEVRESIVPWKDPITGKGQTEEEIQNIGMFCSIQFEFINQKSWYVLTFCLQCLISHLSAQMRPCDMCRLKLKILKKMFSKKN